jgi:serine/threonine protein phosphatase PrpC
MHQRSFTFNRSLSLSLVPAEFSLAIGSTTSPAGRDHNEDSILAAAVGGSPGQAYVLAVADGMGGLEGGERASSLAISMVSDLFSRDLPADIPLALKQAYRRANGAIFAEAERLADGRQMGTTLVSAVVNGPYVTIANVGDSRAYLIRARQLTQITQDHSVVAEQVNRGEISVDQARRSNQRNLITQALGTAPELDRRMPSIYEFSLLPEDRLLLCSDGFFDVLQSDDYVGTLLAHNPQESAVALADLAIARGTTDNVSAVILEVGRSLATVQREQIGAELAENAPRMNPILLPLVLIFVLLVVIAISAYFYL